MSRAYHLGVTGYPLGHSLSPQLHRAALRQLGLDGEYSLYPVLPQDRTGLAGLVDRVRQGSLDGLNVTLPHKQAVLPLLDELTPLAREIGAVNTIFRRAGSAVGENTDSSAFQADLERLVGPVPPEGAVALVLGAGGASRAVVAALQRMGWEVQIAARRLDQAGELATSLPRPARCLLLTRAGLEQVDARTALIVNATPLGMHPQVESSPWPDDLPLPGAAAVYDLVYNPRETRFVRRARKEGLRAAGGIGMLVGQASLAFACWTGLPFPDSMEILTDL